mmetsp:Transcript_17126/g.37255  ORF Transcript_17126/g.37255 Transcript_17126/m.37255 type:complete len:213 (-) Transcript_17126:38-676(-)
MRTTVESPTLPHASSRPRITTMEPVQPDVRAKGLLSTPLLDTRNALATIFVTSVSPAPCILFTSSIASLDASEEISCPSSPCPSNTPATIISLLPLPTSSAITKSWFGTSPSSCIKPVIVSFSTPRFNRGTSPPPIKQSRQPIVGQHRFTHTTLLNSHQIVQMALPPNQKPQKHEQTSNAHQNSHTANPSQPLSAEPARAVPRRAQFIQLAS